MKLYYAPMTRATRPRWLLEELGVPYELVRLDLAAGDGEKPEYIAIHPLGAVPALEDGPVRMHESAAICLYLADRFPEKRLAPPLAAPERALYLQWSFFAMTTLEPHVLEVYMQTVRLPEEERSPRVLAEAKSLYKDAADVLEKHMASREFLLDSGFSAADVITVSILAWGRFMGLLEGYPHLEAYVKRCAGRPANKKARAD